MAQPDHEIRKEIMSFGKRNFIRRRKSGNSEIYMICILGFFVLSGLMNGTLNAYDNVFSHTAINRASILKFSRDVSFDIFGRKFKSFRKYDFKKNTYKMEGYAIKSPGIFKVKEIINLRNYQKWIEMGGYSADEPELYSSLRHFYDPLKIQKDRMTGENVTYLTDHVSGLLDYVNKYAGKSIYSWWNSGSSEDMITDPRMDAREWALTGPARRGYPENKYSLRKGIIYMQKAWSEKNTKRKERLFAAAWRSCGETMHLLSDMTVPAHVRNDAHPAATVFSGLHYDPYEYYVAKNYKKIDNWAKYKAEGDICDKIDRSKDIFSLFHEVALHTNRSFFSSDTLSGSNENGVNVRSANGMRSYPSPNLDRCSLDPERFYIDKSSGIPVAHADWADNTWWNTRNSLKQNLLPGISNNFNAGRSYEDLIIDQAKLLIPVAVKANIKLISMFIPELTVNLTQWDKKKRLLSGLVVHHLGGVYSDPRLFPEQRPFLFNSGDKRGSSWSHLSVNGKHYSEATGDYKLSIIDNNIKILFGENIRLNRDDKNTAELNLFFGGFWVRSGKFKLSMNESVRPPVASPSDTEFRDSVRVSLSSPDGGVILYQVNGALSDIFSEPILLTKTSKIVAYVVKDPYDEHSPCSESVSFVYKRVRKPEKSGRWVLYKSFLIDGVSFYRHECYTAKGSAGIGSWQVSKSASTCSNNVPARSGSGTYSVPPAQLIPGQSIRMKVSVNGAGGFGTHLKCGFYHKAQGLTFSKKGRASQPLSWNRSVVRARTSGRKRYPSEADFKIPVNLNKNGVLMIEASGGGGNFELSEIYVFLYKWKE